MTKQVTICNFTVETSFNMGQMVLKRVDPLSNYMYTYEPDTFRDLEVL